MKPSSRSSVWPVVHRSNPRKFGTGFVVHTEHAEAPGMCTAFLLTCAHVVTDIGREEMTVASRPAELVAKADGDDPDLAVIRVVLPATRVDILPVDARIHEGMRGEVRGYCLAKRSHDLTPLRVQVAKSRTPVPFGGFPETANLIVTVELDEQIEPDQIEDGYSGSPLLIDGRVRAVLDAKGLVVERQRYKVGSVVPISRLTEVWPDMPPDLRRQLAASADWSEPIRSLLQLDAQVPGETAREVFDAADRDLPSWPSRGGAASFAECLHRVADLDRVDLPGWRYDPLAEYVRRVADRLADHASAQRLRQIVAGPGFAASVLPAKEQAHSAAERQQALVVRILPDVDAIAETSGSGRRLRLLPYLLEQRITPCLEKCDGGECRSAPSPADGRLTFLGSYVLETSTVHLGEDLRGQLSHLFRKFVGGVPDRVEFFVPRAYAAVAVSRGVDRLPVRLDEPDEVEHEAELNAWATVFYHIDERLGDEHERALLSGRLAPWNGAIRLTSRARSLGRLVSDRQTAYHSVVVGNEPGPQVSDCLRNRKSVVCAVFHQDDHARLNLANVVRAPVPFVLLSRSREAVATLNGFLKKTYCLRQFPRTVKEAAARRAPHASEIASIVDLPEYRCVFDHAEQEPILNENL